MPYFVKEIFYSLQGEGVNAGRPAVFCRFAGCNLWSGKEEDRAGADCQFCDTDFLGGKKYLDSENLARAIIQEWPGRCSPFVVLTGGEPLLQLDSPLISALKTHNAIIALETNGTLPILPGLDWVTVSPKAQAALHAQAGDELKLVYPQAGIDPAQYLKLNFKHFVIQPLDNEDRARNISASAAYCLANPPWRLGLQTHKLLGLR